MAADKTFVGLGMGPIQSGLFALEAFQSGGFRRIVIAEIVPELVSQIRKAGGRFNVNVAHADRIEPVEVGPVEILNPQVAADQAALVEAIGEAGEVATCLPSVNVYQGDGGEASPHRILGSGIERRGGEPMLIYAAENHNQAAERLQAAVLTARPDLRTQVAQSTRFVNTVIGKMSGVFDDATEIQRRGLVPVVSGSPRAFLVEAFRRILISSPRFPESVSYERGLEAFEEKDDLIPFEEAKLYGHNATHACAAYLAALGQCERLDQLASETALVELLRGAFLEESGAALIRRYGGLDPLFTEAGFTAYVDDLLTRMFNPYLGDTVARVARDPQRKLAWDDRLVGTVRLVLEEGGEPERLAVGLAAAAYYWDRKLLPPSEAGFVRLQELWGGEGVTSEQSAPLKKWYQHGGEELSRLGLLDR